MTANKQNMTHYSIFIFWLPLASTWLMMAIEGPFLAAIIARLAEPKFNLAAYGVAFSFALLIEAPIIMLLSASTALVKDWHSFRKLFRFTLYLNGIITVLMLLLLIPPFFFFLTENLMELPKKVSDLTYLTTLFLLPWPSAIGFRRFYQGILIRNKETRKVAYGTIIRLITMASSGLFLYFWHGLPGAYVSAISLSFCVTVEAIAIYLMARPCVKKITRENPHSNTIPLTYKSIIHFYTPLALTSILSLGAHPVVTFFLGKSYLPLESLAVIPVVSSFLFLFRCYGFSYLEVVIALVGKQLQHYRTIRNFALILGTIVTCLTTLIVLTPLVRIWYKTVSGLSSELTEFAIIPTLIMVALPFIELWLSLQRGIQVAGGRTAPLTTATIIELLGIIIVLVIGISYLNIAGAIVAATAFVVGRSAAIVYLYFPNLTLVKKNWVSVPIQTQCSGS